MDVLQRCDNLSDLIRLEINARRLTTINQSDSHAILQQIAARLGANQNVANLFPISNALTTSQYIDYVQQRANEFGNNAPELDLDEAEAQAFQAEEEFREVPVTTGFSSMLSQMSQWQREHGLVATAERPDDSDSSSPTPEVKRVRDDSDNSESDEESAVSDDDNTDDASGSDSASEAEAVEEEVTDPKAYADKLLTDKVAMSDFAAKMYALINPSGEGKVSVNNTQAFVDHLIARGFQSQPLRKILTSFLNEYSHIRELNYSQFCYYARFVLQRYRYDD